MKPTKHTLILLISLTTVTSFGQDQLASEKNYAARRDSILKETEDGSVYITHDTSSYLYDWLVVDEIDRETFDNVFSETYMKEFFAGSDAGMKHFPNNPLIGAWSPLHVWHNEFYVYAPSDWMEHLVTLVTDSAIYLLRSDDWVLHSIQEVHTASNGVVVYKLIGMGGERMQMTYRQVDPKRGVSLWHYVAADGLEAYAIKVKADNVRNFKMIVNDCIDHKCYQSFAFDDPDYLEIEQKYGRD